MDWHMTSGTPWSDNLIRQIRDLWMQGYSSLYIGNQVGRTRRAVIGKLNRLGLLRVERPANPKPGVPHGEKRAYVGRKPIRALMGQKRSDGQKISLKDIPMPSPSVAARTSYRKDGKPISLVELGPETCRWPIGDPMEPDSFGYCGAPVEPWPCPYCLIHKRIAYHNPLLRRAV